MGTRRDRRDTGGHRDAAWAFGDGGTVTQANRCHRLTGIGARATLRALSLSVCLGGLTILVSSRLWSAWFVYDDPWTVLMMTRGVEWPYRLAAWLGDGLPWAYRVVILGLHLLNGGLLWVVMRQWLSVTAALVALTLFWLHPLPWQAVASITGGREVLLASYVLVAAVGVLSRCWWGAVAALVSVAAALMLKPSAWPLAVLVPVLWASLYGWGRLAVIGLLVGGLMAFVGPSVAAPVVGTTWEPVTVWALAMWRYLALVAVPVGFSVLHDWRIVPSLIGWIGVSALAAVGMWAWHGRAWCVWVWVVGLTLPRAVLRDTAPLTDAQMYLPAVALWIGLGSMTDYFAERTYGFRKSV